eukprot:6210155-Pleurochrysis_carterae.AAC.1
MTRSSTDFSFTDIRVHAFFWQEDGTAFDAQDLEAQTRFLSKLALLFWTKVDAVDSSFDDMSE